MTQGKTKVGWGLLVMLLLLVTAGSCSKEKKCGCDGEIKFELNEVPGTIYYEDTKFTYFISDGIYSYFTLCEPDSAWEMVKKFKSGEHVLVSGEVADDCMKQISAYAYANYVLHLKEIKLPPFRK